MAKTRRILITLSFTSFFLLQHNAYADPPPVEFDQCEVSTLQNGHLQFRSPIVPSSSSIYLNALVLQNGGDSVSGSTILRRCFSTTPPSLNPVPAQSNCQNSSEVNGTNYLLELNVSTDKYCIYKYEINDAQAIPRTSPSVLSLLVQPINPTSVPIFTPLGLLAMVSGLLWFGKRRRKLEI